MRCNEIIEKLEQLSPPTYAKEWDNVGLLAGRREKEIKKICIALDATEGVVEEAIRGGADLLLTHHPLIFSPIKKVTTDQFIERRLFSLIQNDICYYAMHTNFDIMGMADAAADELELENRMVLDVTYEDDIAKEGVGRYGTLPKAMTLDECAGYVKLGFQLEHVLVYGNGDQTIERVAISPGSVSSVIQEAIRAGVEVLITGDIDHHTGIDALAQGICLIDAGHFGLEKLFRTYMYDYIKREMPNVEAYIAKETNPFHIV